MVNKKLFPKTIRHGVFRRSVTVLFTIAWILLNSSICLIGAWDKQDGNPKLINQAYSAGIQLITRNHFTPGPIIETFILLSILASIRWLVIQFRIFFDNGPIEARPLGNATGLKDVNMQKLDVSFREYLTLPRLYRVTTIPGDPDPDQLIEILRTPVHHGWRDLLAAAYAYALPRRTFVISATLRTRDHPYQAYGVSIQVRKLPGHDIELESQWSSSFERALQRAAYAVGAYILPHTQQCRNVPWSEWQGRTIPVSLFRDYQRAKRMARELRYDEALALYHSALLQDANNYGFKYDIGQLYERLSLYPDALYTYMCLVNEIFPIRKYRLHAEPYRSKAPTWWPEAARDPFVIRYRYVVVLSQGMPLARELCNPDWDRLRNWTSFPNNPNSDNSDLEYRPWRVTELKDIIRLLSTELDLLYPSLKEKNSGNAGTLVNRSRAISSSPHQNERLRARLSSVENYLLDCADIESKCLIKDFRASNRRPWRLSSSTSRQSLTQTSVRLTSITIDYRRRRLKGSSKTAAGGIGADSSTWPVPIEEIAENLRAVRYDPKSSRNWLEHYNVACLYALALIDDDGEVSGHEKYAVLAVAALERALKCGEDVDFVRAKRYWLQAGDPDFVGLRKYDAFRAFAGRVYGRPLPTAPDISKYELYLYLRSVIESGAIHVESEWRSRVAQKGAKLAFSELEAWWLREEEAWKLAIRLGRFYRQWQTRRSVVVTQRMWMESFGTEIKPVTYPDINAAEYMVDILGYERVTEILLETEKVFDFLANNCGRLRTDRDKGRSPLSNARAWIGQARAYSRSDNPDLTFEGPIVGACISRAGLWAALRHWVSNPGEESLEAFRKSIEGLTDPPNDYHGIAWLRNKISK